MAPRVLFEKRKETTWPTARAQGKRTFVVNALGRVAAPNDNRFKDNTNGATHWDDVDLVVGVNKNGSLIANSHRSYNWSSDSKDLLTTYYNDYGVSSRNITTEGKNKAGKKIFITNLITNDSVDPSKWSYMNKKFDVSAKAIFGKSLFQLITSPGESNVKGGKNINYKKIKIF